MTSEVLQLLVGLDESTGDPTSLFAGTFADVETTSPQTLIDFLCLFSSVAFEPFDILWPSRSVRGSGHVEKRMASYCAVAVRATRSRGQIARALSHWPRIGDFLTDLARRRAPTNPIQNASLKNRQNRRSNQPPPGSTRQPKGYESKLSLIPNLQYQCTQSKISLVGNRWPLKSDMADTSPKRRRLAILTKPPVFKDNAARDS